MRKDVVFSSNSFSEWNDLRLFAMLVFGEARGEKLEVQMGVANVVKNRVEKLKKTYKEIILKPKQFSCFNIHDPNYKKIMNPLKYEKLSVVKRCYRIAFGILEDKIFDNVYGANHYHDISVKPYWANGKKFVCQYGKIKFYRL